MKKTIHYRIIVEADVRTGTGERAYTAYVPSLGIATDGDSVDEATANAHDAAEAYVKSLIEDGLDIPADVSNEYYVKTGKVAL